MLRNLIAMAILRGETVRCSRCGKPIFDCDGKCWMPRG